MDCGAEFVFTVREQEFFQQKGFEQDPKRCPPCRKERKNRRDDGDSHGGGGGGGGHHHHERSSRGGGGGGGGGGPREFHTIICAGCGKEAEVPFKPTSGRPVYCRDCFNNRR
jgi:CxxC-x17-CxxC domain-containing protein